MAYCLHPAQVWDTNVSTIPVWTAQTGRKFKHLLFIVHTMQKYLSKTQMSQQAMHMLGMDCLPCEQTMTLQTLCLDWTKRIPQVSQFKRECSWKVDFLDLFLFEIFSLYWCFLVWGWAPTMKWGRLCNGAIAPFLARNAATKGAKLTESRCRTQLRATVFPPSWGRMVDSGSRKFPPSSASRPPLDRHSDCKCK